mgnify:CR=1 FL=1
MYVYILYIYTQIYTYILQVIQTYTYVHTNLYVYTATDPNLIIYIYMCVCTPHHVRYHIEEDSILDHNGHWSGKHETFINIPSSLLCLSLCSSAPIKDGRVNPARKVD